MFLATNQSFFMAMFFMISAFFMVPSLERKGTKQFLKDRLVRLGIPLLVYYFFLNPLTIYILLKFRDGRDENLLYFLSDPRYYGFGPMWFVEALLIFTLVYAVFQYFHRKEHLNRPKKRPPGVVAIIMFAIGLGALTFLVRIWLPVGWAFEPMNFQFPHFVQYIAFFIIGIMVYRNNWLDHINLKIGIRWFVFAQVMIFIFFPALFILGGAGENGTDAFMGGFTWQSLAYAIWEQLNGFALIIGLSGIFKQKLNRQNKLTKSMSASAYTAYIIHAPLLVLLTLVLTNLHLYPALKFIVVAPIALISVFLVSDLIRRLPLARKVL
jgi:surface polysaccharide O-acyltransferase-like enzyme